MDGRDDQALSLDDTLAALADPARRQAVELLREQPRRASELADLIGLPRPAMSKHLRVLRLSRLVEESSPDSDARVRVYRLREERFAALADWLAEVGALWTDQLAAFREHVERDNEGAVVSGASVMVAVTVQTDPARAFALFTQDIGLWWGKGRAFEFNPGRGGELRFEPGPDGRLVEAYPGGQAYEIGRITAWEPGQRLAFEWRLPTFRAGQVTHVEITFRAVERGTRVTVEHGGWNTIPADHPARHGLPATAHGQQVGQFWQVLLGRFSRLA